MSIVEKVLILKFHNEVPNITKISVIFTDFGAPELPHGMDSLLRVYDMGLEKSVMKAV
ncbi:hypothetical protein [Bartonella taylorii]|uniref:hypothetical protein n=1 Tax=Bartonella taylorii TaxID=33046 RepID=UPI0031B81226